MHAPKMEKQLCLPDTASGLSGRKAIPLAHARDMVLVLPASRKRPVRSTYLVLQKNNSAPKMIDLMYKILAAMEVTTDPVNDPHQTTS
jgi:hypothetical protein